MKIKSVKEVKTKAEAQRIAIEWQDWQSNRSMSFSEVAQWESYFQELAKKFKLTEEFKENGII